MSRLPKRFTAFVEEYPEIGTAYTALGDAVGHAGPLDAKTRALIKLGVCIGAGLEGGAHSQARKALEAGATPDELRHAALQATTTVGFPTMMRGFSWVEDVLRKHAAQAASENPPESVTP
ncbi:carboxymuconolactone decarboxylase family protein [bacterium]|nr:MAG: carboxymuconolactone decarboxylase family protein [bacterium]